MERSEPTLIPEWLKSSGSSTGGGTTSHQTVSLSSSLHSDDRHASKSSRNKSSVSINERSSVSDRTTSSYFRRSSSSNGSSHSRSHGSLGRSNRDKDWEKEIFGSREKEKSILGDHRRREYSDPLDNILPSRFEKDLRRSQSLITGKLGETWPRKVSSDSSNANKSNPNNSNGLLAFERDFPSLGPEERQAVPEIGRVSSPGLGTAVQSLPKGSSAAIRGDGWTSALAEVPVLVGSNGTAKSVQQTIPAASASLPSSMMSGMNMAETLVQGPSRPHTPPQLSAGTQRLEELAFKQSRQLIPMTPSIPKALALNSSEKAKPKLGQPQHQNLSSHPTNHSPRGGPVKSDVSRMPSMGKLQVLKPVRERNGVSPSTKDSLSPTSVSRVSSTPVTVAPSVVGSAPSRSLSNNPNPLEKKPTPQSKSRNDFFNLMRRKSINSPSSEGPTVSPSDLDKPGEGGTGSGPVLPQHEDSPLSDSFVGDATTEKRNGIDSNGTAVNRSKECLSDKHQEPLNNGNDRSISNAILCSEEEEAAFLRSLGWVEDAGEDEGLTEEEISSFYKEVDEYIKSRPSSSMPKGMQPKVCSAAKFAHGGF